MNQKKRDNEVADRIENHIYKLSVSKKEGSGWIQIHVSLDEYIKLISALRYAVSTLRGGRRMNDDLISRSALKEEFAKHEDRKGYLIGDWEEFIDNAPTVEQSYQEPKDYIKNKLDYSRPQGEWIYGCFDYSKCSNCDYANHYGDLPFCPNCGADMRKEKKDDN